VTAYEFLYALDFFNVELVFRGFLVIGLIKVLGKDAIIPMVTLYCIIHFGKPLGEIISSIIGVIFWESSPSTPRYLGGVIAHIGIAWTMGDRCLFSEILKKAQVLQLPLTSFEFLPLPRSETRCRISKLDLQIY